MATLLLSNAIRARKGRITSTDACPTSNLNCWFWFYMPELMKLPNLLILISMLWLLQFSWRVQVMKYLKWPIHNGFHIRFIQRERRACV